MLRSAMFPAALSAALLLSALPAQGPDTIGTDAIDEAAVAALREHGLGESSEVMELLSWICDVHGPRLTGSPNLKRAQDWAAGQLSEWGLANVSFDAWGPFGRGWQLNGFEMRVVGDNPWQVHAYPKAWSPGVGVGGAAVEGDVVLAFAHTADELGAMDLSDKVVLLDDPREIAEWFDGTAQRFDAEDLLEMATGSPSWPQPERTESAPAVDWRAGFRMRMQRMQLLQQKGPLAILDRGSKGDYGTIFVTGASVGYEPGTPRGERPNARDVGAEVIPQFTLAVEHYNRICRMVQKGVPVRLALRCDVSWVDGDGMERNVLADIPGTDPEIGDELVMLGAHFDSWHSGTGATDNGAGSAVMMEAVRLITKMMAKTGQEPRRTIRIALWSGEEQGLLGSRAWAEEYLGSEEAPGPLHAKVSGYFNVDNGTGRLRGVYLQGNTAVAPIFRQWLVPFHDLGAGTITPNDTGGTDHLSFVRAGVPGFQFIQDPIAYSTRTHHSNFDMWDHAVPDDLRQAATIVASFVWHTAQRDERLPRPGDVGAVEASSRR